MNRSALISLFAASALLSACGGSDPAPEKYGANPTMPDSNRGLLPTLKIPNLRHGAMRSRRFRRDIPSA